MGQGLTKNLVRLAGMRRKEESSTVANGDKTTLMDFLLRPLFPVDIKPDIPIGFKKRDFLKTPIKSMVAID